MMRRRKNDHRLANITRGVLFIGAVFGAAFALRSLPDLRRYLRMERM